LTTRERLCLAAQHSCQHVCRTADAPSGGPAISTAVSSLADTLTPLEGSCCAIHRIEKIEQAHKFDWKIITREASVAKQAEFVFRTRDEKGLSDHQFRTGRISIRIDAQCNNASAWNGCACSLEQLDRSGPARHVACQHAPREKEDGNRMKNPTCETFLRLAHRPALDLVECLRLNLQETA
jgi:hypothetical protein